MSESSKAYARRQRFKRQMEGIESSQRRAPVSRRENLVLRILKIFEMAQKAKMSADCIWSELPETVHG